MKSELDQIKEIVYRISGSYIGKSDKKNTVSRLLAIEKKLIQNDIFEKKSEKRINELLKVLMALAQLNYSKKAIVTDNRDHLDALAIGINMLGEELQSSTISLKEKEVLLKEVHHRVKNNLQIIISLLSLQSQSIKDTHSREKFEETQNRVRSMAMVHEKLYESKEASKINFIEYIKDFIEAVNRSYNLTEGRVALHLKMNINKDQNLLEIDTAVPCALILNELVSNCFKHAFPKKRKGNIYLHLEKSKQKDCTIKVIDDGIGMPDNISLKDSPSLGLQLVAMLAEQIGGDVIILPQKGTTFIIKFRSE